MPTPVKAKVFIIQQNLNSSSKMNVGFGSNLNLNNSYNGAVCGPLINSQSIFVGGYIDNSKLIKPWTVIENENTDNFTTRNGIFGVDSDGNAFLKESTTNPQISPIKTKWAIQNGPILLLQGNNKCNPESSSRKIRTGIGYNKKNELIVVATEKKITFYEFAEIFKKQGCTNAIYLDGYPEKSDNDPVGYKFNITELNGNTKVEEDKMQINRPLLQFFHSTIKEKNITE